MCVLVALLVLPAENAEIVLNMHKCGQIMEVVLDIA